jgi:YD repeat-containing protein
MKLEVTTKETTEYEYDIEGRIVKIVVTTKTSEEEV